MKKWLKKHPTYFKEWYLKQKGKEHWKKWRKEHPEKYKQMRKEQAKRYYLRHKEKISQYKRQWYQKNREKRLQQVKEWKRKHAEYRKLKYGEKISHYNRQYYLNHHEKFIQYGKQWRKKNHNKWLYYVKKIRSRRRRDYPTNYILNEYFEGGHLHHLTPWVAMYIPAEMHKSIQHNLRTGKNMYEINRKALDFWLGKSGKV